MARPQALPMTVSSANSFRLLDPMAAEDLDKAALLDDSARRQAFGSRDRLKGGGAIEFWSKLTGEME